MMEFITQLACEHASHAHFIIFGCLMLAGLNVPISEDLMLVVSGMLASTVIPENTLVLFTWAFLGSYLSDWMAYWIGYRLGPAVLETRWLGGRANRRRLRKVQRFYAEYGVWTLLVGRFIPFGVRNCLFMSAGMGKMPFGRFILSDGIACIASNILMFSLGYYFAREYHRVLSYLQTCNYVIFSVFVIFVVVLGVLIRRRRQEATGKAN